MIFRVLCNATILWSYEEALRVCKERLFQLKGWFGPGAGAEIWGGSCHEALDKRGVSPNPPPGPGHCLVSRTQPWGAACCGQDPRHLGEVEEE